jgi:hypothetical protein
MLKGQSLQVARTGTARFDTEMRAGNRVVNLAMGDCRFDANY